LRVHDARELAALAAQPPTPSRSTNLSLSSSPPSVPHQTPYNPNGRVAQQPPDGHLLDEWLVKRRSTSSAALSRYAFSTRLQAHKLNDGGQRPVTALVRPIGITVRRPTVRPHPSMGCVLRPAEPASYMKKTSVCAGQHGCGAPRRNRTGDPILTMEPPGTAVRTAVCPGHARPSRPKLSVHFRRSYVLTFF
jgi:hypothetical protein